MSALAAIVSRLTALEEEVKTLRTPSLTVFMDCLKTASPEEVKAWLVLSREVAGTAMAELEEEEKPKKVKKKATTNETGPAEWNVFVNTVWHEMAADQGIVGEHDAEFKKTCKDAGITYQSAMKEASRRKAELEGKQPKVKVAKEAKEPKVKVKTDLAAVQAKVAAAQAKVTPAKVTPAKVAAPVTAKVAPAKVVSSELDLQLAAAAEQGWLVVKHEGETFFHCPTDDTAWNYPAGDEQIGTYTVATAFAEAEFVPKDEVGEEEDE